MAASLVQSADSGAGGSSATLGATPTVGNLLVACIIARGGNAQPISGFTEPSGTYDYQGGNHGWRIQHRVVQSGDGATWSPGGSGMRTILMEWSGIQAPDAVLQGSLGDTNVTVINPTGSGQTIGMYGVYTDNGGREVHVVSPSTVVFDNWGNNGIGPWASVGYGTGGNQGELSIQATGGAIAFHPQVYIVANYPLKLGGSQAIIID